MTALRRGFKTEAEQISEQIRQELGVRNIDRLDPLRLASHLDIPVISLTSLLQIPGQTPALSAAVSFLRAEAQSSLSATTVFAGDRRLIVYSDHHNPGRQASDIAHELAHGLLLHEPTRAFDSAGCRSWDPVIEEEATYVAGTLLIPGKGARYAAKIGLSEAQTSERFGCSLQMAYWRMNMSGARRRATTSMPAAGTRG